MISWIATHATATVISSATFVTIAAFAFFGIVGAIVAWGMFGAATYALAKVYQH